MPICMVVGKTEVGGGVAVACTVAGDEFTFETTKSNETEGAKGDEFSFKTTTINENKELTGDESSIETTSTNESKELTGDESSIETTTINESKELTGDESSIETTTINETKESAADDFSFETTKSYETEGTIGDEFSFETTKNNGTKESEVKLSDYIVKVIEYYKQPNPKGLPSANIPDPYYVPDTRQTLGFGTNLEFTDTAVHGVNKFRVLYINADIGKMECHSAFEIDKLQVRGKYSLNVWLNYYPGDFTADIIGIKNKVLATLGVEQDGKLRAQNISVDITFKNITVKFENAGFLASMLQGVFNSMGSLVYDSIRTYLVQDAHKNMREDINKKLDEIVGNIKFPNTISPMDMIMVDVRNKIKDMKMDPLEIEDYFSHIGIFKIALHNTLLKGLSTFHRTGNISLSLENNTIVSDFNIGAKELLGLTRWEVSGMNGYLNKTGTVSFSVEYIKARFVFALALNRIKSIEFRDLHLDVGNIQIGSDGTGTLDYIIELSANILPTLLRYQIIQAMENPVRWMIQQKIDNLNIEEVIINELPKIDQLQRKDFQLSELRCLKSTDEIFFDDEEFFNF
ncbi:uncharacterized protein LOC126774975 [Nymphalis io]|uniref:uncharacterized protein LOC126774975 n=1 Tax=Inachis io TaxID=171585 RepID=UPI002167A419|nr:uncharacterized protein LOC126774975 [Nymphalis io]